MASYSNSKYSHTSESIQFTYNKKPFKSREKAIEALKAKNLLPGEPAVAFYNDEKNKLKTVLGIGSLHDSNSTFIIEDGDTILKNASIGGGSSSSGKYDDFIEELIENAGSVLLDENFTQHVQTLFDNSETWNETSDDVKTLLPLLDESTIQNSSINTLEKSISALEEKIEEETVVDGGDVDL